MVYYLNPKKQSANSGGNYEVHTALCRHAASIDSMIYLGNFKTPKEAIITAKRDNMKMAIDIDGCFFCCKTENKEKQLN